MTTLAVRRRAHQQAHAAAFELQTITVGEPSRTSFVRGTLGDGASVAGARGSARLGPR